MKEKVVNLLGIRKKMTLCRIDDIKTKIVTVIMEPITAEQEVHLDKTAEKEGSLKFYHPDGFVIEAKHIYLYGEVDFNNPDDIKNIERFNLINNDDGNFIHSNFDYDKGVAYSTDLKFKEYPTWNPVLWFQYCHCIIGKPERIIVYKRVINKYG